ncbi:MAG TPA: DUF3299 domain-containing protein [Burkholderiales bacterium]|nr:DUF3299 domain-containing protein [Burkholderiales bacterium]
MNSRVLGAALLLAVSIAFAQAPAPHELPPQLQGQVFKPLPDRKDVVSWKVLAQVELVRLKDRYAPQFSDNVAQLDQKKVKIQGFMMPLEMGDRQSHFILSAMPQTCSFCMPGGPEQLVEVRSTKPVKYTFEPVVLTGKLAVLKNDPTGVYYRLTEALPAN